MDRLRIPVINNIRLNPSAREKIARISFLTLSSVGVLICLYLAFTSYQMDFRAFYIAGKAFNSGLNPYINNMLVSSEFYDPGVLRFNSKFIYPPQFLLIFIPISLLSYSKAKILFSMISFASLLLTLWILLRRYNLNPIFPAILLISFPVLATMERGQIDPAILLLITLSYLAKEKWYSPLLLATSISIKLFPILLLIYFLVVLRDYVYVLKTSLYAGLILLLSLTIVPSDYYFLYAERLSSGLYLEQESIYQPPEGYSVDDDKITTPDGTFIFNHSFIHGPLNPLYPLEKASYPLAIGIIVLFQLFFRKRSIGPDCAFFSNLVIILVANRLLWIMGMVYYFPVAIYHMSRSRNTLTYIILLAPVFLSRGARFPVIKTPSNYILAMVVILFLLFKHGHPDHSNSAIVESL